MSGHLLNDQEAMVMALILADVRQRRAARLAEQAPPPPEPPRQPEEQAEDQAVGHG